MDSLQPKQLEGKSESRFNMWRAVFAMAHADGFLALEEQGKLYDYIEQNPFSEEQADILREDVATPQNVDELFALITDPDDVAEFFTLARALVWCDGNMDEQEEAILTRLHSLNDGNKTSEAPLRVSRKTGLVEKLHDIFAREGLGALLSGDTKE